jgi:hypothetical protein
MQALCNEYPLLGSGMPEQATPPPPHAPRESKFRAKNARRRAARAAAKLSHAQREAEDALAMAEAAAAASSSAATTQAHVVLPTPRPAAPPAAPTKALAPAAATAVSPTSPPPGSSALVSEQPAHVQPTSALEGLATEHGSEHADTSAAMLADAGSHAPEGGSLLSEDWLPPNPPQLGASIAEFTEADFPHAVLPKDHPEVVARCAAIDEALFNLDLIAAGRVPPGFAASPERCMDAIAATLPDPAGFRGGGLTRYYHVWEHLLGPYARSRLNVRWLLKFLKKGIAWPMVAPATQHRMPDFKDKIARVHRMLAAQVGRDQAVNLLRLSSPAHVHFPNHRSTTAYPDFVTGAIEEAMRANVLLKLPPGQVPLCTAPLGVADNKAPKLRLIIDPAYVNMLLRYEPLRYEQLADVKEYAKPGDWATTTDEKSGYFHIPLHPSMWTHFGIHWQGQHYVFTHMAFGIGPACRAYTVLKQELFRVIRARGNVRMSFLIDDQCNLAQGRLLAQFQAATILSMQRALGFTLSLHKCQLEPTQRPHFLGMEVDLQGRCFRLPEEKICAFQALVAELVARPTVTARCLAKAAGKLVSYAPAIGLAPLYARQLYKIMKGMPLWDTHCPSPAALLQTLHWVSSNMREWNGHRWFTARTVVRMAGDYSSERGYGAYTLDRNILADPIVVSLSDAERTAIAANELSSTYGELMAVHHALTVLTAPEHRHLVANKALCYEGDNQGSVAALTRMSGNDRLFPLVRAIHEQAKAADVELLMEWHPRSTPNQEEADALSKLADNSEWVLDHAVFEVCIASRPELRAHVAGAITIDLAASTTNAKAPRFMSRFWCPGTEGVNMFMRPTWAFHPSTGKRELCYINGDFSQMGAILSKVARDRADCVIVYPDWPRYWQVLWASLPVKADFALPRKPGLCTPGVRVEQRKRRASPQAPHYTLRVAVVIWDEASYTA